VLLSAAFGLSGGLFVLDMGAEVRIGQLAERLVRLKGLRLGRDITIDYVGLRPGEKLREELYASDERLLETDRTAVWRVEPAYTVDGDALLDGVRALDAQRRAGALEAVAYPELLRSLIDRAVRHEGAFARI
jgi:FlaA1/EpsC-like NDP-sugar epimerase